MHSSQGTTSTSYTTSHPPGSKTLVSNDDNNECFLKISVRVKDTGDGRSQVDVIVTRSDSSSNVEPPLGQVIERMIALLDDDCDCDDDCEDSND